MPLKLRFPWPHCHAAALVLCTALPAFASTPATPAAMLEKAGPAIFGATGAIGVALVVVTPSGIVINGYGQDAPGSERAPAPNSLIRISSTSKLLTADVALKLAAQGKLSLDDPLQRHAPPGSLVPVFAGARPITLKDLATHTAGLPREPDLPYPANSAPATWPTAQVRWQWLATYKPAAAPATAALYSNVGFDLLADALAQAAGKPYPLLLREMTTAPLAMGDTTSSPSPMQCARLMRGADGNAPCADTSATAGTGGMYSSPADMGSWMAYVLGLKPGHRQDPQALQMIYKSSALASVESLDKGGPPDAIGLGWIQLAASGATPAIVQKTGGGAGFMSYMAVVPGAQVGVFAVMTRLDQAAFTELVKQVNLLTGDLAAAGRQAPMPPAARAAEGESCMPAWPASALGRGESGTTRLRLRVAADGTVTSVNLTASSGFADLDQATMNAARACRFAPKLRNGLPAATSILFDHVWARGSSPSVSAVSSSANSAPRASASAPASRKPCARLAYPAASLASREQGTVHMTFLIDADGAVLEKNVVKGSGFGALDRAALEGMAMCRFTPAVTNGKPEKSLLSFSYTWTLN